MIRPAEPTDDFTALYGADFQKLPWNYSNIVVDVRDGSVRAAAIFWDSGHPILYVEEVKVLPELAGRGIAARLMRRLEAHAKALGKVAMVGPAHDLAYLDIARRWGASVGTTPHYMITRML